MDEYAERRRLAAWTRYECATLLENPSDSNPPQRTYRRIERNGLWGYCDHNGKEIIPCQWNSASGFLNGYASVEKDGKFGIIDATGSYITPCQWDCALPVSGGVARVGSISPKDYPYVPPDVDYDYDFFYTLINLKGERIVDKWWFYIGNFTDGYAMCMDTCEEWDYVDTNGKNVVPTKWDRPPVFRGDIAIVQMYGKEGVIDLSGKVLIPCKWDHIIIRLNYIKANNKDGTTRLFRRDGTPIVW